MKISLTYQAGKSRENRRLEQAAFRQSIEIAKKIPLTWQDKTSSHIRGIIGTTRGRVLFLLTEQPEQAAPNL
ncbi:hypothetical protein MCG44_03185 [Lawsonibacter sp. OA9]|uniref:hypothetical protein n=1 Tax=Lawsonibacter sp. OA9 TaxID=2914163 RepID=UPI001F070768|nr:hypothetical protein [Lawsonibacter sp. OA9]MCH1978755.1 hypothetical protein [Lawsonibacter sp. OA9]